MLHRQTANARLASLALARAAFEVAVEEKPGGRFMIRNRIRVVKRYRETNVVPGNGDYGPTRQRQRVYQDLEGSLRSAR